MKEITNTGLLVSVSHSSESANLEVFDVSRKGQAKKIYSFEEVPGGRNNFKPRSPTHLFSFLETGSGDVTYNSRRGFLGAIPADGEIDYHLYHFSTSKAGNTVKLIRKSLWHHSQ